MFSISLFSAEGSNVCAEILTLGLSAADCLISIFKLYKHLVGSNENILLFVFTFGMFLHLIEQFAPNEGLSKFASYLIENMMNLSILQKQ